MVSRSRFDLIVRGGLVVTGNAESLVDLGIRDGRIHAIAERLEDAPEILDAQGRLVLPGGVDAHCHMDQPVYGAVCADDFQSGTLSAACGGNTTIVPFAMAGPSDALAATVAAYRQLAQGKALIDYAIHPTLQAATAETLDDLPALILDGYASLKIFTTYDGFRLGDAEILEIMQVAARHGAIIMVHAENDGLIEMVTRDLIARGHHAPRFHADARPVAAEREAIHRIASFAEVTGAEVLIVHVSSREGLDEVRRAQARGVRIHAETCPQYLLFTAEDMDREGLEGAKFMCSPPMRTTDDQDALWDGMARGSVAVYSSDHSPYRFAGPDGKLRHGPASRFDQIANGLPGLELRLPLLFSEGYLQGRISLAQFIAVSSTNAADLHGLAPRKGAILVGADADLVIWDQERETTITHAMLHDGVDYTPYEGMRIRGWPVTTVSRGEVIVDDGRVLGAPGRGRFVPSSPRPVP